MDTKTYIEMWEKARRCCPTLLKKLPISKQLDKMVLWFPARWDEKEKIFYPAKNGAFMAFSFGWVGRGYSIDERIRRLAFMMLKNYSKWWSGQDWR